MAIHAVPGPKWRGQAGTSKRIPPDETVFTESSSSNTTFLPSRVGSAFASSARSTRSGRDRQLRDPDADRVVDRGRDRRRLRVVRHLADALRAVRSVGGGVLDHDRVDLRHVLHPGSEVGPERAAAVVDLGVVRVAVLEDAEPEAHHRAALDLALDQRRVDRTADVVALLQPRARVPRRSRRRPRPLLRRWRTRSPSGAGGRPRPSRSR